MNGNEPEKYAPMSPAWALFAFLGAIIGGAFMAFILTGKVVANGISYVDLAAVVLVAVTVVLTVFGLAIAIAAIYGYQEFMNRTATKRPPRPRRCGAHRHRRGPGVLDKNLDPDIRERARTILSQLLTAEGVRQLAIEQTNRIDGAEARDRRLDAAQAASHLDAAAAAAAETAQQEAELSAMDAAEAADAQDGGHIEDGQRGQNDDR